MAGIVTLAQRRRGHTHCFVIFAFSFLTENIIATPSHSCTLRLLYMCVYIYIGKNSSQEKQSSIEIWVPGLP